MFNEIAGASVGGPSGQGDGIYSRVFNYQVVGGTSWTVSPTSLLEFRFGVSLTEGMKAPATMDGGPDMLAAYGIPGLPTNKSITGGLNTSKINGYANLGRDWSSPQHQNPFVVNPKLNYSRIQGRHTLKAGYEYQAVNTQIDDFHPKYGQDTYGGQFSRPASVTKSNNLYHRSGFSLRRPVAILLEQHADRQHAAAYAFRISAGQLQSYTQFDPESRASI
jgi:hypothetical protein